jgi:hypothetical protein
VVWVTIADVCQVVDILHVDDERIFGLAMNGARLKEGDILKGRSVLPGDVQLILLINLRLFQLIFLGLPNSIGDIGANDVLI